MQCPNHPTAQVTGVIRQGCETVHHVTRWHTTRLTNLRLECNRRPNKTNTQCCQPTDRHKVLTSVTHGQESYAKASTAWSHNLPEMTSQMCVLQKRRTKQSGQRERTGGCQANGTRCACERRQQPRSTLSAQRPAYQACGRGCMELIMPFLQDEPRMDELGCLLHIIER